MQKFLDVVLVKDFSTYLWYSLKACILQTNPYALGWFYNRFTNIVSYHAYGAPWDPMRDWLKLDYIECNEIQALFEDLIDFYSYNAISIKNLDIAQFVKQKLMEDTYVQLEVDEYYIYEKDFYYKEHFYHPILIYGFDDIARTYNCIGFGKNNVFKQFTITELELYESTYSATTMIEQVASKNPNYNVAAVTMKKKPMIYPAFDRSEYCNAVNDFLHSVADPKHKYLSHPIPGFFVGGFGVKALLNVPRCIRKEEFEHLNISFLDSMFLQERAKGLRARMQWYMNEFWIDNAETKEMFCRYDQLQKDYRKVHFALLREFARTKALFIPYEMKHKIEVANEIERLVLEEQYIVDGLVQNLWS